MNDESMLRKIIEESPDGPEEVIGKNPITMGAGDYERQKYRELWLAL